MEMNVWKLHKCRMRYYIKHPLYIFKQIKKKLKYCWQRITKGYCDADIWNWDEWLLELMPRMLDELATVTDAYPDTIVGSLDEWKKYLHGLAANLRLYKDMDHTIDIDQYDTWAEFNEAATQVREEQEAILEETFIEITKNLRRMWW